LPVLLMHDEPVAATGPPAATGLVGLDTFLPEEELPTLVSCSPRGGRDFRAEAGYGNFGVVLRNRGAIIGGAM